MEDNMNILRAIPLVLACAISLPLAAESYKDDKTYLPPDSIGKNLTINSSTKNTTTFRFLVKSLIGKAEDVKLTAKVVGEDDLKPVPSVAEFKEISERKNAHLDFVLPITKEQIKEKNLKIQCNVEYLPDYDEIIKRVEAGANTKYQIPVLRNELINKLKKNKENSVKSNQAVRYIP